MSLPSNLAKFVRLANRREWLCKNAPRCVCGAKQVQLIGYHVLSSALWRCRVCHKVFTFEPEKNESPN